MSTQKAIAQAFQFHDATVRTLVGPDGEPWFVAADVCRVLEIGNVSQALSRLDDDETTLISNEGASNGLPMNAVNESGLYSLVLGSRKPEAKAFKRWVTREVLPAIRKTGGFGKPAALPGNYTEALEALLLQVKATETLQLENEAMRPKADFYDAVTSSEDTVDMNEAAKLAKIGFGRTVLFRELRRRGVLRHNNTPYQKYLDSGYFAVVESKWEKPDGSKHITLKTVVYQRGVEFLRRLFTGGLA